MSSEVTVTRPVLSKFRQSTPKKPSALFEGESIAKQLQRSSFGGFHTAVLELQNVLPMLRFKLPRVIVIGGKSAGKSSLLENITKCAVFPRKTGVCTKMPVRLQLSHVAKVSEASVRITWRGTTRKLESKDDILHEVATIMDAVANVVSDEITIQISQVDVPTFEFVDLPGIQLFPEAQHKLTTDLANKYLAEEDTLVLCVVDATIPSLDSSIALKTVRDANKLHSTILALTKSDLVRTELEIVDHIFDRILGQFSESQHMTKMAGCVAVANRNHTDHLNLLEGEAEEQRVFGAMLEDPAEYYAAPETALKLQKNMTVKQLILQLDVLFHNFTVQRWKPAALACLAHLQQQKQEDLDCLGTPPWGLNKDTVLKAIYQQVDYDTYVCHAVTNSSIWVAQGSSLYHYGLRLPLQEFGTLAWAELAIKTDAEVTGAVKSRLNSKIYLQPVLNAFQAAFSMETSLKPRRFKSLQDCLMTDLLPNRVCEAIQAASPVVLSLVQATLSRLDYSSGTADALAELDNHIRGCVLKHIIQHVKHKTLHLPESFILTESEAVTQRRSDIMAELAELDTATAAISNIEKALHVSDIQPEHEFTEGSFTDHVNVVA